MATPLQMSSDNFGATYSSGTQQRTDQLFSRVRERALQITLSLFTSPRYLPKIKVPSTNHKYENHNHKSHQHRLQWDSNKNVDIGSFIGSLTIEFQPSAQKSVAPELIEILGEPNAPARPGTALNNRQIVTAAVEGIRSGHNSALLAT
ncbi:hypothetical protein J6590_094907 [Homalodisca vitripennis]|nr:hypothetical protein J6590_094907 [Homalodisca vitripennis]